MDCPICYETILQTYALKGCTHSLCKKCYRHIKHASPAVYPFGVPTVKVVPIQCPLCRTKEDIQVNPKDYPVEYKQWMELVINENESGDSWYSLQTVGTPMNEWIMVL
jgi:hypothetical protein